MKNTLSPYLTFKGNCREAMTFYQSILGGELTMQTFGETMPDGTPPSHKDQIMHASLQNDALSFMASDGPPGGTVTFGNNVHLSLVGDDEAALTKYFNRLAEDGDIKMPLAKQFWGDTFGMLTDRFGIHWMVNISARK